MPSMSFNRTERLLLAVLAILTHGCIWLLVWGFTPPPAIATTSRSGGSPFTEQYWFVVLSASVLFGAWRGWHWRGWTVTFLVAAGLWLFRYAIFQQYGM